MGRVWHFGEPPLVDDAEEPAVMKSLLKGLCAASPEVREEHLGAGRRLEPCEFGLVLQTLLDAAAADREGRYLRMILTVHFSEEKIDDHLRGVADLQHEEH